MTQGNFLGLLVSLALFSLIAPAITAAIAFFIGALWVAFISNLGIAAPRRGAGAAVRHHRRRLHLVRRGKRDLQQLFSAEVGSAYCFDGGWSRKALIAFPVASVWTPGLSQLSGYAWIFGAPLGAALHYGLMRGQAEAVKRASAAV